MKYWLGSNRFATTGAFGAHPDHDAHLLSTLSAIQILITHDALDRLDIPRVVKCMWEIDNLQPIAFLTTPTLRSHSLFATALRGIRRRFIWRDRHAISVLRSKRTLITRSPLRSRRREDRFIHPKVQKFRWWIRGP